MTLKYLILPSIVPAVVGLTNLFCIICCIINPDKASELPESRILTVLEFDSKTKCLFVHHLNGKYLLEADSPINKETIVKITNKINKV